MDPQPIIPRSELECILFDESLEPKALSLSLLEHITNGFCDDKEIGHGGFARVYKGILDNGNGTVVAVKKLLNTVDIDEKKFIEEVSCMMKAKQKNIVRFLGYCSDTQGKMLHYDGKLVLAEVRQRLLCFEYLPKGSLDKQITDASRGLEWSTRYKIITGICDGLYYLHKNRILHLDLKPENILLDDNMMPKIADFGLSRCFDEEQSWDITSKLSGTLGYLAPEFIRERQITFKSDIYSLGIIIIEMLTGKKGYPNIENVLERWSSRMDKTQEGTQLLQLRVCIEIGMQCTDFDPVKRPDTQHIIHRLGATKSVDVSGIDTGANNSSLVAQSGVPPAGPTIGLENTMANVMKKSTEELYNLANQDQCFSSVPYNNSNMQQGSDIRETASDVEGALIIGRTEEKQKIVATLSGSITTDFTILPIYGIGGIGKTTLAQLIFNDSQFADYSRVWVYVSQNLDLNRIGNSIISQLSEVRHVAEKQMIHNHLRNLLAGKKILIVLDDVWEKNPHTLKTLNAMLRLGADNMVKVIVTTRDEAIAREICRTVEPYKIEAFSDNICWKIIKQKTAFKDRVDKKQLKNIGREIATKCGGVALAAQSLGYMLNGRTSDEWESVSDNDIWNLSSSEDPSCRNHEVLASLMLSYIHMPECLKLCFSYCAVFPKGHNIKKYDLIHQWIALGFTGPSRTFDPMQLCEKYITQLVGMSFLQYSIPSHSGGWQGRDDTLFMMHDLVHDLAKAILANQVNHKGSAGSNTCRYALLTDCSKPLQLCVASPTNLKSLHILDHGRLELSGDAFSSATCLHVLDLSACHIRKLPDCIGQLKKLRYLHAPMITDRMFPKCITELSELSYLNLSSSLIEELPESIGDMKVLMHLDLSYCTRICILPKSFTELKQLVHLDLSNCQVSMSEDFGSFTKLQYLNLSVHSKLCVNRGLSEVIGSLRKLRYLNLSGCMKGNMPPSEDRINSLVGSISILSNLEHLNLSQNPWLCSIPESIGNLRKLHTLDLLGCYKLKKLPNSMVNLVSLKVLNVNSRAILDESVLSLLNVASLPHFAVHASSDKCSSNIILLQSTNPVKLEIDRLENVKSAEEVEIIKLIEKRTIKVLAFKWPLDAARLADDKHVLEKLVPPSSVHELNITGYSSACFPYWFIGISQCLTNLVTIHLCDFPNCTNLPPLGQLPSLQWLGLSYLQSLAEWNTAYPSGEEGTNELLFPKLETLNIQHCAKLRIKPCLPRATSLHIVDCDVLLSSGGESSSHSGACSSSPITNLCVNGSKLPLHQWRLLHQLPALRSLDISCCSDLTASPEIIQFLSSFQLFSLKIFGNEQEELLSWLGELTSLEKLKIQFCRGIRSLPDSIQQLMKLERLTIRGCPTMREWCESEENMMKLAHIRDVKIFCDGDTIKY